jgi:hypothetical protein
VESAQVDAEKKERSFLRFGLRKRLFRLWIVISFAGALGWLAFSGPKLIALTNAQSISCFPVISGKIKQTQPFQLKKPKDELTDPAPETPSGGSGICDSRNLRFVDLSQPEKEVAVRINHINVFDARSNTFKLYEKDQLNPEQRDQLEWYFQAKAAQRCREIDFLLIFILGPIFAIPVIVMLCIHALRWIDNSSE